MLLTVEKVIILRAINLFSEISEHDLLSVAMNLEEVSFANGATIINQGDIGTSMYIIVNGCVDVEVNGVVVATLNENDVFGELAALDPEPRSATVRAKIETMLFKIDNSMLYNLILEYPNVARGIIHILCQRIRNHNEKSKK